MIDNKHNEDFEIVDRINKGETELFGILQKRYFNQIKAVIRRMIQNEDDVEDLAQETFIKAFNALERFQPGYPFAAWLYRIASNTCIDFLRKRRFTTISISQSVSNDEDELYIQIEDMSNKADDQMLIEERSTIIRNAIESLPEKYRLIINLRHESDLDYKDIAEKLDIPLGTVKAQLFRARKLLLDELKAHSIFSNLA
ncbi:MAG: sigma-70 family RNA polymerase sigma factor [bacterium]